MLSRKFDRIDDIPDKVANNDSVLPQNNVLNVLRILININCILIKHHSRIFMYNKNKYIKTKPYAILFYFYSCQGKMALSPYGSFVPPAIYCK